MSGKEAQFAEGGCAVAVDGLKKKDKTMHGTMMIDGQVYKLLPMKEYEGLLAKGEGGKADEKERKASHAEMVSRELRYRRAKAELTQAQVASRAGLRVETISRIERGTHRPRATSTAKIFRALGDEGGRLRSRGI